MITVLGLGFVGLTSALGFAEKGFKVYGYEIDQERLDELAAGKIPFHEPGLSEQLRKHLNGNLILTSDLAAAIKQSEIIMFCVGTPSSEGGGEVDLRPLKKAIAGVLESTTDDKFRVLCIKSSVPPSTTCNDIGGFLRTLGKEPGSDIGLANNPEFLREGHAWEDFIRPDRIVVGTSDSKSRAIMSRLYEPFDKQIHHVNLNTGEFIKYLSNTLLATLISFSNELSMIAHTIGEVDIQRAFNILHEDKRWSGSPAEMTTYAFPGCGFGGYCLPKDTLALVHKARMDGFNPPLLEAVLQTNEKVRRFLVDRVANSINPASRVALLGLSFKPHSDDVRMSPSAWIIEELITRGITNIVAYDPISMESFRRLYGYQIGFSSNLEGAIDNAAAIILVTAWPEFKEKRDLLKGKRLFDFRYFV